jgi:hypothetical protein
MKKPLDWKVVGQFLSVINNLHAVIRDTFKQMAIDVEIIPWLLGDGKEFFIEKFLKPLGAEFLANQRIKVINENTIMVNLGAPPKLPFEKAIIEANTGGGWVEVKNRKGKLYQDGREIGLYLSDRQKDGQVIKGHELREKLSGKPVLHPNILDALFEHQHLIPEDWKKDERGNIRYIFFWAVIFRRPGDEDLYVRCFYFRVGQWSRLYDWLGSDWVGSDPAALLAS